ncbi:acyl carrier protein [Campylobacter sp. IFREMER_LSEM_CL1846]|uniref:acyl carrier protein n=1 Tax=unclassified Campylobacter TaxID=2593542 RepID=UPI0021E68EDF|nr:MULTISPECIES: acyl carrier protein [unclassified Campylobacter]HEC1748183.1 acyl carrier protein [Campylobacter lari]MCV3393734.1 acyl carrier protein [Campylobacter sp. IFREMER_LSEM_CL908]MCV3434375.1 acyl carrier protein [Campylobacter sp. IFREMER_LSEM_CL1846]HEC1768964.1 acyl carrier protein [Campylobacter lari]HEC1790005.1 acyl carrier protein [Campylobacter lari]
MEQALEIISKISKISKEELIKNANNPMQWSSFTHIEIVMALEEEFGCMFDENEIIEMKTLNKIFHFLEKKIAR